MKIKCGAGDVRWHTEEQLVRLALRVADCLHTAVLCGHGHTTAFRAEAKDAESELREFINEPNDSVRGGAAAPYPARSVGLEFKP